MKISITIMIFLTAISLYGQPKIFELWFEDSVGNRDTLWFGYDPAATGGVDEHLGEVNIMGEPYDSTFFVFFTDAGEDSGFRETFPIKTTKSTFMMKYQNLSQVYYPLEIGIIAKNWPLSISWTRSELEGFSDQSKFVMTSFYPAGCWFDCISCGNWPSPFTMMEETSKIVVYPDYFCKYFNEISPDTINLLYVSSEARTYVKQLIKKKYDINYDASEKEVSININDNSSPFHVSIIDMYGRKALMKKVVNSNEQSIILPLNDFHKGIYFIVVTDYNNNQKLVIQKIAVL